MKLRLLRNGSTLARLGLIKIDYQPGVSLFKVLQNSKSTEWQTIASLKKGDAVTVTAWPPTATPSNTPP